MLGKKKTEVLVAGAGPVGLFAAAHAAHLGLKTVIADDASRTTGMSYALGLHGASVELLEELDLAHPVLEAGNQVNRMVFYDGPRRVLDIDLAASGGKYPFLTILPQSALENALQDWLKDHHVDVKWRHRVGGFDSTERPVEVTLEEWQEDYVGYVNPHQEGVFKGLHPITTQFVVGCDGHRSLVRNRLQIEYPSVADSHLFGVFEFDCGRRAGNEAVVIIDDVGLSILWPLPNGHYRWSFELPDENLLNGERNKSRLSALGRMLFPSLDEEKLTQLVATRAPWFDAPVREVLWSVAIRFEYRLAEAFGRDALWLAGDAGHLGGPVGIHSMNVGLREARDLTDRMYRIMYSGGDEGLLAEYNRRRLEEWSDLMNLEGRLKVRSDASDFVHKNATTILACLPASGPGLEGLLDQAGLELPPA